MSYKLTIVKYTKNSEYAEELAKYRADQNYYGGRRDVMEPKEVNIERSLEICLSDAEFSAIKKAALEVFE